MTAVRDNANAESNSHAAPQLDLAALVRRHQTELWRYVRYLGASVGEADDLVQEAFLAVHRRPFERRDDVQTTAYLRTVIRRCLLMARRREGREISTVELESAEEVWSELASGGKWERYTLALEECLRRVSDRAKRGLDMSYRQQLSQVDIARELDMKPAGVKTLLRRARATLRECIQQKVQR